MQYVNFAYICTSNKSHSSFSGFVISFNFIFQANIFFNIFTPSVPQATPGSHGPWAAPSALTTMFVGYFQMTK